MIQPVRRVDAIAARTKSSLERDEERAAERRAGGRTLALYWAASIRVGRREGAAVLIEMSAGGMRLKSALVPSVGAEIAIDLPGQDTLTGEVRWAEGGRFGVKLGRNIDIADIMRRHWAATGRHLGVDRSV